MSWLSQGLKKVGGVAKKVAPFAGLIPGVGTLAGAAIGGLGSLASGDNIGEALKNGAIGGLSGYGGSKLLGGKGILGIGGALKKVGGRTPDIIGADQRGNGGGTIGGSGPLSGLPMPDIGKAPGGGGLGGVLGGIGGLLGGSGGVGGFLGGALKKVGGIDNVLGAGALGYGAYQQKQAGDMREKALKLITDDYATRAPLRTQGLSGMLNEQRPDLSSVFASQNPFRRVA